VTLYAVALRRPKLRQADDGSSTGYWLLDELKFIAWLVALP